MLGTKDGIGKIFYSLRDFCNCMCSRWSDVDVGVKTNPLAFISFKFCCDKEILKKIMHDFPRGILG